MSDIRLMTLLLNAIASEYPDDGIRPGLVLSELENYKSFRPVNVRYYASVTRYNAGRDSVCHAYASTPTKAIRELAKKFMRQQTDAGRELAEYLKT